MINEMVMKNVWKIELRSANKLSYDKIKEYFESHEIPLTPVRGKFDTYWITPKLQVEFGVDCFLLALMVISKRLMVRVGYLNLTSLKTFLFQI